MSESVILRDFKIRPLALAGRRLSSLSSLKLQIATKDAKVQKPMNLFPESEDVIWIAEGGAKVSSIEDLNLSVINEDNGVAAELCSVTLTCAEISRTLQRLLPVVHRLLLKDDTSSTQMLVIFATLSQGHNRVSGPRVSVPSYYLTRKRVEFDQLYQYTKISSQESRAHDLHDDGYHCLDSVMETFNSALLDRTISSLEQAVRCSSILERSRAIYLADLASALCLRFEHTGDVTILNRAVTAGQDALLVMDEDDPHQPNISNAYATAIELRYRQLGDVEDLQLVISQIERTLKYEVDPNMSTPLLSNLAFAIIDRFERLGDIQDIETAILHLQKALKLTPDGSPYRPAMLHNLGYAFMARFGRLGSDWSRFSDNGNTRSMAYPGSHFGNPLGLAMVEGLDAAFVVAVEDGFAKVASLDEVTVFGEEDAADQG